MSALNKLQEEYDLLSEKIHRFRMALSIETDVAVKFKLEKQLEEAEAAREQLEQQLEGVERLTLTCPYRGLFIFREQDEDFFFGRESYTETLVEDVQHNPCVALIGASGSGKSSLVYAGLIPHLRKQNSWLIVDFRPRNRPFDELALCLVTLLYTDKLEQAKKLKSLADDLNSGEIGLLQIVQLIVQAHPGKRLLLIVDQFEELYTLCQDEQERRHFLDELLSILPISPSPHLPISPSPHLPIFSVLLTMRADFMGQAVTYGPLAEALNTYPKEILGPMDESQLRNAIEQPAKKQGVTLEEGLTGRILQDLGQEPGNLPLLEFTLAQLWERQASGHLTHAAYNDIGEVEGALAHYADEVYARFDSAQQENLRHIFVQLVRPGEGTEDTRQIATRQQIGEKNWDLVTQLADARLVVTSTANVSFAEQVPSREGLGVGPQTGTFTVHPREETVEIVHEALIRHWQPLREWMDVAREFRIWQNRLRQAIEEWENAKEHEELLLPEVKLAEAEAKLDEHRDELSERERVYIEESIIVCRRKREERERIRRQRELEARERVRRHRKRVWGIGKNLIVGLVIFGLLLFLQDTGWLQLTQNGFMDAMMRIFPEEIANTRREIPPLVFLDIDEDTYQDWGEPLLARDRLLQLIKTAVEGNARVIVVDIFFTQKTPGISRDNRDALHPDDQALYDYLFGYSDMCRTNFSAQGDNVHCPQILLIRSVRWSQEKSCPEIRMSFLDEAVNTSPDIHWSIGMASLESDQILRRVRLWQPACRETGQPQIIPSIPLLTTAFAVQPDHSSEDILRDLQDSLQPLAPQDCSDCESLIPLDKPIQVGKDEHILRFSQVQQRILYRIPWKRPTGQGLEFTRRPARLITQALDRNQLPDTTFLDGSIVMIGTSFAEARDIHPTPLEEMPGSLILLNAIYSLLQYGELRSLPVAIKLVIEILLIVVMSMAFIRFYRFRGILLVSLLTYVACILVMVGIYHKGMWVELDIVFPLLVVQLRHIMAEFRMASEFNVLKEHFNV